MPARIHRPDGPVKPSSPAEARARLTDRQYQILAVCLRHYGSTKYAAHELGIARNTVRNHRTAAFAALGAQSAIEAWTLLGWTRVPPP